MATKPNIQMLEIVARGLSELKEEVVFVGGATTGLYITDPVAPEVRPTDDVDCIIEISSRGDFYKFEKKLRAHGFKNKLPESEGRGIIARWDFSGITVDIMPTDEKILGFSNRWYREGIKKRQKISLSSGDEIFILSVPYFLATKLEAFRGRGKSDYRLSSDIEDIITVIDGGQDIPTLLEKAPKSVHEYLVAEFQKFVARGDFNESIYAHLPPGLEGGARSARAIGMIKTLAKSKIK